MIAVLRPYGELPAGSAIRHALKYQVIGLLLLATHVILTEQTILLYGAVLLLFCWIYVNAPLAGLLIYFQFLIYQNWMISFFAQGMMYSPTFVMLQGTNFILLALMAMIGSMRLIAPIWWRESKIHMTAQTVLVALAVALAYAVLGTAKGGATSAAVYFREFTGPAMAALVGLDIGRVWGFKTIALGFLVSVALSIAIAIIEILIPTQYYGWINAANFMNLKSTGNLYQIPMSYGPADVIDRNTSTLFNMSGTVNSSTLSFRFMSTIMHPISYAYVLAVTSIVAISVRRSLWLAITLPMLLLSGVKGGVLLFVCSVAIWATWVISRSRWMLFICGTILMVAYVAFGISRGIDTKDWHVIGFLGGVNGFVHNPIGHGLGVGGNLSSTASAGFQWTGQSGFMQTGADFALELAVGVLIYQMGIGAAAIFAVFIVLLFVAPFGAKVVTRGIARLVPQRQDMLFVALATVVVNGVFQEEAYAPTGAALLTLLCAVMVVNYQRNPVLLHRTEDLPIHRRIATA